MFPVTVMVGNMKSMKIL